MTFSLTIDRKLFNKHLSATLEKFEKSGASVTPVIKGNGYGFGRRFLANEASALGIKRIAVGTVYELDQALTDFGDEILVLEPFNPQDSVAVSAWEKAMQLGAHRVIATISGPHFAQASRVGIKKAFIEGKTSLHRFGVSAAEVLTLLNTDHSNISVLGLSLHLPIADPVNVKPAQLETSSNLNAKNTSCRVIEISSWLNVFTEVFEKLNLPLHLSVSHVDPKDIEQLAKISKERNQNISLEVRLGTSLWLGEPKALEVTGTVLEIHEFTGDHEHVGYRQVDSHVNARLLIVSGGTAHGVALAAPTHRSSPKAKTIAIAQGFSEALGKVRSPYKLNGKNLPFAEPPHMHVSLLWCEDKKVEVGDQLTCTIRNTTANFDQIVEN